MHDLDSGNGLIPCASVSKARLQISCNSLIDLIEVTLLGK